MSFFGFFRSLGIKIGHAFKWAYQNGLSDALVQEALRWVRIAEQQFIDNTERREWVVRILVSRGVPDSVARLAVELAVQLWHRELDRLGNA